MKPTTSDTPSPSLEARKGYIPVLLVLAFAIVMLATRWSAASSAFGFDFFEFWVVARQLREDPAPNVYSDAWRSATISTYRTLVEHPDADTKLELAVERRQELATPSSPLLYTALYSICSSDYSASLLRYHLLMFGCGIAGVIAWCRLLRLPWIVTFAWLGVLYGWSDAFIQDAFVANVSQIQLLALAALLWGELRAGGALRDYACGAGLAVLLLFKPNLLPVAALLGTIWLASRQWRTLGRHLAGFVIAALLLASLPALVFDSLRCWPQWMASLPEFAERSRLGDSFRYSLNAVLQSRSQFLAAGAAQWVVPMLTAGVVAWASLRRPDTPHSAANDRLPLVFAIALGAALPLISSPIAQVHYFVLAVPLLLLVFRPGNGKWRIIRYTVGAICLILLLRTLLTTQWLGTDDVDSLAMRLSVAAAGLFLIGLIDLCRGLKQSVAVSHERPVRV